MRVAPALLALTAGATLLSACGQSAGGSASDQASAPAAPPPMPTPDQIKSIIAALPAPYNAGDYEAGKTIFTRCAACHTTTQGGPNMTGPNLYGVFGRKAGTAPGFSYSDGVSALGWTWDAAKIDQWITNPRAVVPDTHMTFPGLSDPADRANVIAYLKVATSPAS
jgi:cytochrome c